MASIQITFTLDSDTAEQARRLDVDIPAAARRGVTEAVRKALTRADRAAYERTREHPDPFWEGAEAWSDR